MLNTPIKKQLIGFSFLLFICLSVPLGAAAQNYTVTPETTSFNILLRPWVNGAAIKFLPLQWSFSPNNGTATLNGELITDDAGVAKATVNFGAAACGTYTYTVVGWRRLDSGDRQILYTISGQISGKPPCPPGSSSGTTSPSGTSLPPGPTKLFIVSGYDQTGIIGEPLAEPFVVRVRDTEQDNKPLEGVGVTFTVLTGGGSLSTTTAITDVSGLAKSTLTLGNEAGTNTVEVGAEGVSNVVTFSVEATLLSPVPTNLSIISGDNQEGLTGEPLANPLVTAVRDQHGDPMEGVTVTFAVTAGDGSLSTTTAITDLDGQAETTLTLGTEPGTITVKASVEGISQTEVFNAEATLPPPTPTTLSIISGENQKGLTGEPLANSFIVQVHDQYGNPMEGVMVTFTVSQTDGMLSATAVTTDPAGLAESTLTLGTEAGTYTVEVSAEGITDIVTFSAVAELLEFDLSLSTGLNLIHLPLKVRAVDGMPTTIQSVSALYTALGGASTVNFLITYDSATQEWLSYFVPSDKGTSADRGLTADMGIIAGLRDPVSVQFSGDALGKDGSSTIVLNQGLNVVGLPLRDSRVTRVSDLFTLDGIGGNVSVITLTDGGAVKVVGRAGDPGDIEITGGQAFIMTAQRAARVDISGDAWTNNSETAAAPLFSLQGIKEIDVNPVLGLSGSIVNEATGAYQARFRVTVKNLSTGRAVTGMTKEEGTGYRLTVVDIETGRAATVGDILEISAQSPHPLIGAEPLRYTVTAEDMKRSLIQLPELVVYKIPAETALLRNYPNPFNPETWIPYRLAEDAFVTLTIYDTVGQVVRTLDIGHRVAATYESRSKAIYWDGRNHVGEGVASGVYFYTLTAGDYSATRRMLIIK